MIFSVLGEKGKPMDDLISRQDVIDALDIAPPFEDYADYRIALEVIKDVPSAQKKGHWIDKEICFTCSECAHDSIEGGNFCPNCGADMRD